MDYDKLIDQLNTKLQSYASYTDSEFAHVMEDAIAAIKTLRAESIMHHNAADVAPVRHGRWEFPIFADSDDELDPRVRCSECGGIVAAFARWNYCPNCGAPLSVRDTYCGVCGRRLRWPG